jgi:hypothetical protein
MSEEGWSIPDAALAFLQADAVLVGEHGGFFEDNAYSHERRDVLLAANDGWLEGCAGLPGCDGAFLSPHAATAERKAEWLEWEAVRRRG